MDMQVLQCLQRTITKIKMGIKTRENKQLPAGVALGLKKCAWSDKATEVCALDLQSIQFKNKFLWILPNSHFSFF